MIFFNVKKARDFLVKNGYVYTLRRLGTKEGITKAVHGSYYKWKEIGDCTVEFVSKIYSAWELEKYLEYSGFGDVVEWLELAKRINYFEDLGVYLVTLKNVYKVLNLSISINKGNK